MNEPQIIIDDKPLSVPLTHSRCCGPSCACRPRPWWKRADWSLLTLLTAVVLNVYAACEWTTAPWMAVVNGALVGMCCAMIYLTRGILR